MIVSASRRTDIPAFYTRWLMNRVRAGWCLVPNPLNSKQVSYVSLRPADVDAVVFWSKNPAPLLPHLDELDRTGLRYYFQFTLNDYAHSLEPGLPPFSDRIETFSCLSRHVGPYRIVWRYDPIVFSNLTTAEFHEDRFSAIADRLRGKSHRVMVSVVDFYRKTERRLAELETESGFLFQRNVPISDIEGLLKRLADIARRNDFDIFSCAEERDYSHVGVPPGRCIDERLIAKSWPLQLKYLKDRYQRASCLCEVSKDIGVNNTCVHGCPYCYATADCVTAERRHREHNPDSPVLWGDIRDLRDASSLPHQDRLLTA